MKNGLYKVDFKTQMGNGAGVVHLHDGKILGGDSALAYIGDYVISGDSFHATVNTKRHSHYLPSVFGKDEVTIVIKGRFTGDRAALIGTSPSAPGVEFEAFIEPIAVTA